MIVFWIIGVLFLVVGLIVCVPRYRMFLKYKGRASGKIIKIETNGKTSRAIFEYSVEREYIGSIQMDFKWDLCGGEPL